MFGLLYVCELHKALLPLSVTMSGCCLLPFFKLPKSNKFSLNL